MAFGMSASEFRQSVIDATGMTEAELVAAGKESLAESESWLDRIVNTAREVLPKAVSSAQAALAQLSYSGTTGNFLSTEEPITLSAKFFKTVDQYPEKIGSPLHEAVYINSLSGFVQCRNAVFSSSTATTEEDIAIEAFMNNGFFYE